MAVTLDALVPSEEPVGFLCECGCLAVVPATLADYKADGGAWLEEHKRKDLP